MVSHALLRGPEQKTGGYQIRVFRSRNLTGPYVDQNDNPAVSHEEIPDNWRGDTGVRMLASVAWNGGYAGDDTEISQGHNSALLREDGRIFMVYHTRFIGRDEDDYETRVRELFTTSDGWLVAAPYEYQGSVGIAPHNANETASIAGDYEVVLLRQDTYFDGTRKADGTFNGVNTPIHIRLETDGSVTVLENENASEPSVNVIHNSWKLQSNRDTNAICGNGSMSITLDGTTYTGVFAMLPRESDGKPVMTFSALGGNVCIWGSQQ
ncbi:glycoside hydrolase family 43 protein [Bifidobacterium sp. ESL0682]|uniref:glycoside hydrolase family 43 protein n=1 Tax=Bifidobacterium sp. ESL0682 TaxID=2983212 RepID=UPI0023F7BDC1|nr:glycoside hydrolase family 43 protein [Bifidobacterium sp. ESL0682]WEV42081.1 glycoside hydrolase family 43 protein [Bifidobacterium sp. ESL0682]